LNNSVHLQQSVGHRYRRSSHLAPALPFAPPDANWLVTETA
jgi:hypothetical protein